jgi:uncharacterized protein with ACT and thioredoxin-like domain
MALVKREVMVPEATDVMTALANGWQPWDDVHDIVDSVTKNLVPVASSVTKVPAELAADPVAAARLGGLIVGDLCGFAITKLKGK